MAWCMGEDASPSTGHAIVFVILPLTLNLKSWLWRWLWRKGLQGLLTTPFLQHSQTTRTISVSLPPFPGSAPRRSRLFSYSGVQDFQSCRGTGCDRNAKVAGVWRSLHITIALYPGTSSTGLRPTVVTLEERY